MFLLPNNQKIDEDGVIDAMLDTDSSRRYFLDTFTGEVGCIEKEDTKKALPDPTRYLQVARIPAATQLKWMKEFMGFCVDNRILARLLSTEIQQKDAEKAFLRCKELLNASADGWIHGWREWQGQSGFEEVLKWFSTLPLDIEDKFEGCGDCEMCKLMEQGEHNLGDFLEAAAKEKRKANEKKNK